MFKIETIHHVSLPVSSIEKAKDFYGGVLKLKEIKRPDSMVSGSKAFPGAWYEVGDRALHLIVDDESTFRKYQDGKAKPLSSRDIHFAIRVQSFGETLRYLLEQGYDKGAEEGEKAMKVSPKSSAGFPQIYITDPDNNVIELNAAHLDLDETELKELGLGKK